MAIKITNNALDLLEKRYFHEDESTWEDICERVSTAIASAEINDENRRIWKEKFYNIMSKMDFIPSSPCLMNAEVLNKHNLSSCFIIDLKDNIESIYEANANIAKIFQKNGGVGMNLSVLRPNGTKVETSKGYSCGAIGFMEIFDLTANIVTRNNSRKGAIKIDLNDWHPDIIEFVHCKDDITKLSHMNISVSLSDNFMKAVMDDRDWVLKFPDYSWNKKVYDCEWNGDIDEWESKGYPVVMYKKIKAKDLYQEIMQAAWSTGEPGVSFRDHMEKDNIYPAHLGKVYATNPCAEFSSIAWNSCNLGSINLNNMGNTVNEVKTNLKVIVPIAVRFLDNMITVNKLPLAKIEQVTKSVRSIGLGVMGLAELLYKLKYPYGSQYSLEFVDALFGYIKELAEEASRTLAYEKGVFPEWETSKLSATEIRNSNLLSVAPTGSISFIANVSGGIEPNYALVYKRLTAEGEYYNVVNEVFLQELHNRKIYSDDLIEKVINNNGSCKGINKIPKDMQSIFVTAHDIKPEEHLEMLSIIQNHVDLSVSKTINLPQSCIAEEIAWVYFRAWQKGCKGVTVYRDNCRQNQTLSTGNNLSKNKQTDSEHNDEYIIPRHRPQTAIGFTSEYAVGCGKLYITFNYDEHGKPMETFVNTGATGVCSGYAQGLSRMISICLRANVDPKYVIKQLRSVSCPNCKNKKVDAKSCPDAFGQVLLKGINDKDELCNNNGKNISKAITLPIQKKAIVDDSRALDICECGHEWQFMEGCKTCPACGASKCG